MVRSARLKILNSAWDLGLPRIVGKYTDTVINPRGGPVVQSWVIVGFKPHMDRSPVTKTEYVACDTQ